MRRLLLSCIFIATLLGSARVDGAVFRVGSDASCTHGSIQAAIDAAALTSDDDDIRISGGPYTVAAITIISLTEAPVADTPRGFRPQARAPPRPPGQGPPLSHA